MRSNIWCAIASMAALPILNIGALAADLAQREPSRFVKVAAKTGTLAARVAAVPARPARAPIAFAGRSVVIIHGVQY